MAEDMANTPESQQRSTPNPDLKGLDKLVGIWKMSGDTKGKVTYEWMEDGFFLIQHIDLDQSGQKTSGDTLMIWFGEKGSPAYYQGQFSEDGNTLTGNWVYPGGGGYEAIATRQKKRERKKQ